LHLSSAWVSNFPSTMAIKLHTMETYLDPVICATQWNAPSIGFYEKTLGAKALVEWDTMRLEGDEEIGRLARFLD
jgi:hypothetical protein